MPVAMSRPARTGTTTARPPAWRITWWLPLMLTTVSPARSSALTTFAPELPAGRPASGHVEGQRQLLRRTDLGQQCLQRVSQAGNRGFRRRAIADRPGPRTQLGRGTPDAVLVLLDDVRHMDYPGHNLDSPIPAGAAPAMSRAPTGLGIKPRRTSPTAGRRSTSAHIGQVATSGVSRCQQ
jgi:hypothetical protein